MLKKPVLSITELLSANIINGETEIFNLINYKTIDGVIILGDTMIDKKTVYDIQKKCKENNIPHVNVNDLENYACLISECYLSNVDEEHILNGQYIKVLL